MKKLYSFDIEIYKNYFLIKFQNIETKSIRYLERFNDTEFSNLPCSLADFIKHPNRTFISFNGIGFDAPLLSAYIQGRHTEKLKEICDTIINTRLAFWKVYKQFNIKEVEFDHIDLQEPAHGVAISLKGYMGRMASKLMQDLPIEPDAILTRNQADQISTYCDNDLTGTTELYYKLIGEIELRKNIRRLYDTPDLRSKGGAQVATAVLKKSLEMVGVRTDKRTNAVEPFNYTPPHWVKFKSPVLNEVLHNMTSATFTVKDSGHINPPSELKKSYEYSGLKFQPSIGGLHSKEKKFPFNPTTEQFYGEADCQSFYPALIIEEGYTPTHLNPRQFLKAYRELRDGRIADKSRMYEIKAELAELRSQ